MNCLNAMRGMLPLMRKSLRSRNKYQPFHAAIVSRYRLPTDLAPNYYNVTLWPRLSRDSNTGLYIFTGDYLDSFSHLLIPAWKKILDFLEPTLHKIHFTNFSCL